MAAPQCTVCGARHRSEETAAKCQTRQPRDSVPASPAEPGVAAVTAEDVLGVVRLMDGRLVRVGDTGVLAVSPNWLTVPRQPPLPREIAHQNEVVRILVILQGDDPAVVVPRLNAAIRAGRALTTVFDSEVFEDAAQELTRRHLKSVA